MVETRKGMFCYPCGGYTVERREVIDRTGYFICDACGGQFTKTVLPLFIVTGASGAGKSAIIEPLQHLLSEYGVFDKDQMWAWDWRWRAGSECTDPAKIVVTASAAKQ